MMSFSRLYRLFWVAMVLMGLAVGLLVGAGIFGPAVALTAVFAILGLSVTLYVAVQPEGLEKKHDSRY